MTRAKRDSAAAVWFVPVLCIFLGLVSSIVTILVDRAFDYELIPTSFTGGPDAALQIFNTIAASMVSLAALVLTITMVVVQLAMGQFSPRIVQRILRDKPSQIAIGVFVATFAHAMLAMREVKVEPETVPGVAVVVAYLLVFASIVVLVMYVHHLGQALRVSALIELVGNNTRKLVDERYADRGEPIVDEKDVVRSPKSGVVARIETDPLVAIAAREDCVIELVPALGEFVPAGAPLVRVRDASASDITNDVLKAIDLELERTLDQDVAYGFRLLVDIAERSLSESPFADPTTAVQSLDRLHDCLRQLARRPLPDGKHRDERGTVRLITAVMTWDDYVHLAFEEIRLAGIQSPQITRRLEAALRDLLSIVPAERRPVLETQLDLLESGVRDEIADPNVVAFALEPDPEGIGEAGSLRR